MRRVDPVVLDRVAAPGANGITGAQREHGSLSVIAALAALGTAAFCFVTGEDLPVGLLPGIAASLHTSLSATGLLVTAYAVVVVVASAPLTHLTRHVPRRFLLSGLLATFVVTTLAASAAPSYGWLLAVRVVTAMAQAVYWSIAAVTAAGLLRPEARARAVAGVFAGSSVAVVLGVPAGTWTGQQTDWRVPFAALSALGMVSLCAVAYFVPTTKPSESHAAAGSDPSAWRYGVLVATTVLVVAGFFTSFTYISPFLTRVSGLPKHDVASVLFVAGIASTVGVASAGALYSRWPGVTTVVPVAVLALSVLGLYQFGTDGLAAAGFQSMESFALGSLAITMSTTVLVVAPRSTEIASAWSSAAFNVGIASGPVIGGLVLSTVGLRSTALAGGMLASAAFAVAMCGHVVAKRRR
jgi:predicted MFS family arabinose efflux permease